MQMQMYEIWRGKTKHAIKGQFTEVASLQALAAPFCFWKADDGMDKKTISVACVSGQKNSGLMGIYEIVRLNMPKKHKWDK